MPPSSREEILRRLTEAENNIDRSGAQLQEILVVYQQAETVFGSRYPEQRKLIPEILRVLKMAIDGIEMLKGL